jgi:lipoprotein NlpI/transglutaminase-like putative cysteine protease
MSAWRSARIVLGFISFSFVVCATASAQTNSANPPLREVEVAANAFALAKPVPSWVDPVAIPATHDAQPVTIRLADTQFMVGDVPIVFVHRALTINDAASLTNAGQLPITFFPQYQHLTLHTIHILRGQETLDRTASSTIRFLQRETGLERGVYNDAVTAAILVNDLRVGDTLEYSYSLLGQNPVFGGKFVDAIAWDQAFPTGLRRVVLNYPAARRIDWRLLGEGEAKSITPVDFTHEGMRKLVFEQRSLAPATAEQLTPPDYFASRWLQFSEFPDWGEVAAWAGALFQYQGGLDDDLREVAAKLRALPTSEERVVAALEFVQTEIRYFSLSLGESSHRPTSPNLVLKRRYGDCKDKSLLLITLLKELGIESNPVLLRLGRRKGLEKLLPSPELFDHVIVRTTVDGNIFYLDPTRLGQHGRLNRMGQVHEGAPVLLVSPETRQPSTIASVNSLDLALNEVSETVTFSNFGADARLEVRQVWNGDVAETVRVTMEHVSHDRIVKSIGDALEARYPGAKLVGEPEIRDDRVSNVVSYIARYDVPKMATERDGNWFVRYNPTNFKGALVLPPSATRATPLAGLRFPYEGRYSFEVKFPDDVSVTTDPVTESVEDKYFTYNATSYFRGNVSKTTIDLKTRADRVEVQDLREYVDDLQSVGKFAKGIIFVSKAAIKSALSLASEKQDFSQTLRARLQEAITKTTETIHSGKLTGSDLANTYCNRSSANIDLGQAEDALRDANEALRLAPNSSAILSCRAEVYFHTGAFEKSIEDYSKAIALGATGPRNFHQRGISEFYAGRLDEAADDLAKASGSPNYDSQMYSDLWLTWTHQRLGRPIPDAVAKRAATQPRGDWPRPALAMLNGNLAPEDMLNLLDSKMGDDHQMALAEGYFYVGQYYLTRSETTKAREFFEKTRRLGVIIYTEHAAAQFELQRLENARQSGVR